MMDDDWTVLLSGWFPIVKSREASPKSSSRSFSPYFQYFGWSPRYRGVLGRSASSWFKRSASFCRVDRRAPVAARIPPNQPDSELQQQKMWSRTTRWARRDFVEGKVWGKECHRKRKVALTTGKDGRATILQVSSCQNMPLWKCCLERIPNKKVTLTHNKSSKKLLGCFSFNWKCVYLNQLFLQIPSFQGLGDVGG